MKSLMQLLGCALADASAWCCASTTLDLLTIKRRVKHEGMSFLTISLPNFATDFEKALSQEMVSLDLFLGFKRRGALPQFLGGLLDLVFDRGTGRLLDEPNSQAIFFIRQICLMFKKILLPCSKERDRKAYEKFIQCENDVKTWEDEHADHNLVRQFAHTSSLLWGRVLSPVDRMVYEGIHVPRHGPGATAERISSNAKFNIRSWHSRLEEYFPVADFAIPNYGFSEALDAIDIVEPGRELPVRVITVPKTLKTPRIIAIEPVCMQYAQQSLLELLVSAIEGSDFLHGCIGFTDQVPNQELARIGSADGSLATIDLSEASDRVSNLLVKTMLQNFPTLAGAVDSCRSRRAITPLSSNSIELRKFASMGSALCFPIEAMVFLTIIVNGIQKQLNRSLGLDDIQSILASVRVYGDDIIVPIQYARSVLDELTHFGLKVNLKKTFVTGKFRESCGKDYYNGSDVTVTYVRRLLPQGRSDAAEMVSSVSLRNQLYRAGLWRCASYLDHVIGRLAPFPRVLDTSPVLGRYSYLGFDTQRMCPKLFRPLVKGLTIRARPRPSFLDGHGALLKFFLKRGFDPIFSKDHLKRYGRPLSVDTKIGWFTSV